MVRMGRIDAESGFDSYGAGRRGFSWDTWRPLPSEETAAEPKRSRGRPKNPQPVRKSTPAPPPQVLEGGVDLPTVEI